ncbi:nucleoside deaminase [Neotabrizicola shimadae]|uniref:Nucleoside deaminase n=1 Tax=Neotabrizicola shimadae TaxID=2807096 RepID=A0A8G0ZWJ9_9RHOB|nr:nucleoside deaminase [Neotabrizicola shimadae]
MSDVRPTFRCGPRDGAGTGPALSGRPTCGGRGQACPISVHPVDRLDREQTGTERPCTGACVAVRLRHSERDAFEGGVTLPELDHVALLRLAIGESRKAREAGNHPFACILVGPDGTVLMTQHNAFMPDHDMTGHAERVLMTRASTSLPHELLKECTIYTSAEPCAMCAGAIYWTGLKRVVFGLTERALKEITGNHPENPTLDLPCEVVFAAGQRKVEVIGPMLEDEAAAVHEGFWSAP